MLTLPIKKKWFDMILNGIKTEEYREIKPYYSTRFQNAFQMNDAMKPNNHIVKIKFTNGYGQKVPYFIADCNLKIHSGNVYWGAEPGQKYYVLHIERIYLNET